jgi:adenine-specific DNA-methyltransferase
MPKLRQSSPVKTDAYRHTGDKRKNIPPAKIAAEGEIPQVRKARYHYSPHLSPELRFDPTGKADRVMEARRKVDQYLTVTVGVKVPDFVGLEVP